MAKQLTITVKYLDARIDGNRIELLTQVGNRPAEWRTVLVAGVGREDGSIIAIEVLPAILADAKDLIARGGLERKLKVQPVAP